MGRHRGSRARVNPSSTPAPRPLRGTAEWRRAHGAVHEPHAGGGTWTAARSRCATPSRWSTISPRQWTRSPHVGWRRGSFPRTRSICTTGAGPSWRTPACRRPWSRSSRSSRRERASTSPRRRSPVTARLAGASSTRSARSFARACRHEATAVLGDVIERATADSPGSRYAHPRAFASAAVAAAIGVGAVPANGARPQPASRVAPAAGRKARAARPREPRRNLAAVARSALGTARTTAARTAAVAARTAAVVARSAAATGRAAVAATRTVPQRAGRQRGPRHELGQRRQPRRR